MDHLNPELRNLEDELDENLQNQAAAPETAEPPQQILNIVSHPGSLKMTDFDGKGNWKLYKAKFDRVSRMNNWGDAKIDYLWIHLTSDALAYAEELPDAHVLTYDALCVQLGNRFDAARLTNVHKATLLNRRRRSTETLAELGQDIRQLVNYAYPTFNAAAKEEIAIEKFLDALTPDIRKSIYQDNPANLNQAIERGLKLEAWSLVEDTKHGKTVRAVTEREEEKKDDSEQIRLLKDLQNKVQNLEIQRKSKRDVQCYYCQKYGHIMRDCNSKKRDEGQNAPQQNTLNRKSNLTCYRCGGRGHRSSDCATPASVSEN